VSALLLRDLLDSSDLSLTQGDSGIEITGIQYSSRQVIPGNLFVAIPGYRVDGHAYIQDAIDRGAIALVVSKPVQVASNVTVVTAKDSRLALAQLSAAYYDHPSRHLRMIGVTGTNGKTTVTYLLEDILRRAGLKTGLLGTIGMRVGQREVAASHTTPESRDLQCALDEMRRERVTHVVMEVSSHSLALSRVAEVEYDTVVFTNLTQDHLDFHSDMEDYFQAKSRLFSELGLRESKQTKTAVINGDDAYGRRLPQLCRAGVRLLTYGLDAQNDLYVSNITSGVKGSSFTMHTPKGNVNVEIATPGVHSVYNALAATGAAIAEGISLEIIRAGLGSVGVPGRMEPVDSGQSFGVFVDYAHSPDSLENVLRACRSFTQGRLIVVFGCGGDRDRGKRPLMGEIAARLADVAVLTSDNPRSEDPLAIIDDVMEGVSIGSAANKVLVEPDRRAAILQAITLARPGDVVLLAGKGHETYQIMPEGTTNFDDREEARMALKEVLK
jgi:UDP-N-acetylmuramoyl-L-alanyl-D-glutamate--2,6-diaminopimelate ligase